MEKLVVGLTSRLACFSSRSILRQTYTLIPTMPSTRTTRIAPPAAMPAIAPTLRPSLSVLLAFCGSSARVCGGAAGGVGDDGGGVGCGGGAGGHGGLGGLAANETGVCHSLAGAVSRNVVTCVENKAAQPSASWLSWGLSQRQIALQAGRSFGQARPVSANQQLGPRWPAIRALISTWVVTSNHTPFTFSSVHAGCQASGWQAAYSEWGWFGSGGIRSRTSDTTPAFPPNSVPWLSLTQLPWTASALAT